MDTNLSNNSQNSSGIGLSLIDHVDGGRIIFKTDRAGASTNLVSDFDDFPDDAQWHHLVVTGDGADALMYLDGALVGLTPLSTIGAASKPLRIGSNANGTVIDFQGGLDDLRLYDRAISPSEIQARFQSGHLGARSVAELGWSFERTYLENGHSDLALVPTSAYRYVDGVLGKAAHLDGVDDVLTSAYPLPAASLSDRVTFATWLRIHEDLTASETTWTIATNRDADQAGFALEVDASLDPASAGRLRLQSFDRGVTAELVDELARIPDDRDWHHLVWVQEGDLASLYLDGLRVAAGALTAPAPSSKPLTLGADPDLLTTHLPADLDETVFRAGTWEAAAIGLTYWQTAPDGHHKDRFADLEGFWSFDETYLNTVAGNTIIETGAVETVLAGRGFARALSPGASLTLDPVTNRTDETLNFWFETDQTSGTIDLLDQGGTGGVRLRLDAATGQLTLTTYGNPGSASVSSELGAVPSDGEPHLITVVREGSRARFIVDGVAVGTGTGLLEPAVTADPLKIVAASGTLCADQLEVAGKALSHWEILDAFYESSGLPANRAVTEEETELIPVDLPLLLVRADSGPFGLQRIERYNQRLSESARIEPHGFTGQEKEDELDLYYFGARYYFPESGRFLQRDPMEEFWNPFSYVGNDPINWFDLSGNASQSSKKTKEALFALMYPGQAKAIGAVSKGANNISTISFRFAENSGLARVRPEDEKDKRGTEVNALRHVIWQGMITLHFGEVISTAAGMAHEDDENIELLAKHKAKKGEVSYVEIDEADSIADLLNNELGRALGKELSERKRTTSAKDVSRAAVGQFFTSGFYVVHQNEDGTYSVKRKRASRESLNKAMKNLQFLFHNGMTMERMGVEVSGEKENNQ